MKRGNDALIALHDRLHTRPLRRHLSLAHTYLPHVTVGRLADRAAFERALAVAVATDPCIETVCAGVSIFHTLPNGGGEVATEIALGG